MDGRCEERGQVQLAGVVVEEDGAEGGHVRGAAPLPVALVDHDVHAGAAPVERHQLAPMGVERPVPDAVEGGILLLAVGPVVERLEGDDGIRRAGERRDVARGLRPVRLDAELHNCSAGAHAALGAGRMVATTSG